MRLFENFERIFGVFLTTLGFLVATTVAFFLVSIVANWTLRMMGYSPIPWARDVIEYSLFGGVFLGAPWLLRQHAHVRVDLLLTVLPSRARKILEVFLDALGFAICTSLALFSARLGLELSYDHSFIRKTITVDAWVLQAVIAVSMVLCMIEFIIRIVRASIETADETRRV